MAHLSLLVRLSGAWTQCGQCATIPTSAWWHASRASMALMLRGDMWVLDVTQSHSSHVSVRLFTLWLVGFSQAASADLYLVLPFTLMTPAWPEHSFVLKTLLSRKPCSQWFSPCAFKDSVSHLSLIRERACQLGVLWWQKAENLS